MGNKAWVSEAMDLYARAMLMFDKRDRNMDWAKKDKAYSSMTMHASRTSVDRRRLLDTVKLASMCHKTGMRLMRDARDKQDRATLDGVRYRFLANGGMEKIGLDRHALPSLKIRLDYMIDLGIKNETQG